MNLNDAQSVALGEYNERILLKPKKAFELLDISRSTGYAMIASGELPSIRIGRAVRIPVDALKRWVEQQTTRDEHVP